MNISSSMRTKEEPNQCLKRMIDLYSSHTPLMKWEHTRRMSINKITAMILGKEAAITYSIMFLHCSIPNQAYERLPICSSKLSNSTVAIMTTWEA